MTAPELTEAEAAVVARFEATPAAPESFDPIAALRRVEALANLHADRYRETYVAIADLRYAIAPQAER